MTKNAAMMAAAAVGAMLVDDGFDPIADAVRARGRGVIATILEEEPDATPAAPAMEGGRRRRPARRPRTPEHVLKKVARLFRFRHAPNH
jgi:hypothetical protein